MHHHMHGATPAPPTYKQGKHQLDFTFITLGILPALLTAGFLPFNIPFILDHWTIYADFDSAILFNRNYNNPIDSSKQGLVSSNPKRSENFLDTLSKYFMTHNIAARVQHLSTALENRTIMLSDGIQEYKTLNKEITQFMLSAEKKSSHQTQGYAWSVKLVTAARK
eukprot:3152368-Ditylum_brightwellii.AAC.1